MYMSYNLFPSFKAIRYFERMTGKSFLELENNPDLLLHLIYCCLLSHPENNFRMTFDDAIAHFFPKHGEELANLFANEMKIINQFNEDMIKQEDDSSINEPDNSSPAKEEKLFLSSLIPLLITNCHLDIDYVLNEFDYTDTKMYLESSVEKHHEEMENQRLWTYLTVAPHISSKANIKKAEDLIEFSWEKGKRQKEAEEKMKQDREKLIKLGLIEPDNLTEENNQ